MDERVKPFLGMWILDPDQSRYDQGAAPLGGSMKVAEKDGEIGFFIKTVEADGQTIEANFSGIPDGEDRQMPQNSFADTLSLAFESSSTLTSEAKKNGIVIMTARRELDDEAGTLTIYQTVHLLDVGSFSNEAVYVRAQ
ncbi:hypothetical protein E1162_06105 [Rhodobacteraceae bacterium RKSG542]|uniref:hypothetical protein n=1 Tax=Pseudovibrio flavus TaxID=2529854 RepID=UPI0012BB4BDA|nr:hypothetical protein [Pseudovibrio flavus]MTI16807.1 hypothetical protein [Pseudovibrio flavus]